MLIWLENLNVVKCVTVMEILGFQRILNRGGISDIFLELREEFEVFRIDIVKRFF